MSKTKKDIQSEKTIQNILDKSLLLFGRKGYHATTMADLAHAASLTKGGLYCHFRSKEELFSRVVKEVEKQFVDPLIQHVGGIQGNAIEKLIGAIKFNGQYVLKHKEVVLFLLTLSAEVCDVHYSFESILKELYDKYRALISKLIDQGKQEGTIRQDVDSHLMALFFIGAHDGILLQWSLNHDTFEGRDIIRTLIKVMSKGFSR